MTYSYWHSLSGSYMRGRVTGDIKTIDVKAERKHRAHQRLMHAIRTYFNNRVMHRHLTSALVVMALPTAAVLFI